MGLRFRQRIKLAPGININLGLGGASLSLGGPGASLNIGRKGVRGTVGVPGSGLSYSEQLASFSKNGNRSASQRNGSSLDNLVGFRLSLNDDDQIRAELDTGNGYQGQYADSRQWLSLKSSYEGRIKDWLDDVAQERNHKVYGFSALHESTPSPGSRFNPVKPFNEAPPRLCEPDPLGLLDKLNPFAKNRYEAAVAQATSLFQVETREFEERRALHERYMRLALDRQRQAQVGDIDAMTALLNDCLAQIDWPKETLLEFEFPSDTVLCVDVDLPEIEDIDSVVAVTPTSLNGLTQKTLKASELNQLYHLHVHGILVRIVGEAFSVLPTLDSVVISGYTQRRNARGEMRDDYVLSLGIDSATWGQVYPQAILNPAVIMDTPCSRVKHLAAHKLGSIEPFQVSDFSFS